MRTTIDTRTLNTVVATVDYDGALLERLRDGFAPAEFLQIDGGDKFAFYEALAGADALVLKGDITPDVLVHGRRLQWIHCDHAGLEKSATQEIFDRGILVTGSGGRSGPALAQHAFYFALALTYDAAALLDMQAERRWRGIAGYDDRMALWGRTLGVVGYGHTGREMAKLGRAFGMRVLVFRRDGAAEDPSVDQFYSDRSSDSFDDFLAQSDVVMLATKLTDRTHHMISAAELRTMKTSSYLINLARGGVVDEAALVEALRAGEIAGAGLDVLEQEPPADDAPIWNAPNVLITSHQTPKLPDKLDRAITVITENARRFRTGEPLINLLSEEDLYTKGVVSARIRS